MLYATRKMSGLMKIHFHFFYRSVLYIIQCFLHLKYILFDMKKKSASILPTFSPSVNAWITFLSYSLHGIEY